MKDNRAMDLFYNDSFLFAKNIWHYESDCTTEKAPLQLPKEETAKKRIKKEGKEKMRDKTHLEITIDV